MLTLDAYSAGQLQDMLGLLEQADGMTVAELRAAITSHAGAAALRATRLPDQRRGKGRPGIRCDRPGCTGLLALYPVNVSRCTAVGGGWRSQALCRHCGFERYTTESVAQIVRRGKL